MVINEYCKDCQIRRNSNKYPATASTDEIAEYRRGVRNIIAQCDGLSTPQISEKMIALRRELFGPAKDFTTIKQHFNRLMLDRWMVREVDQRLNRSASLTYNWKRTHGEAREREMQWLNEIGPCGGFLMVIQ